MIDWKHVNVPDDKMFNARIFDHFNQENKTSKQEWHVHSPYTLKFIYCIHSGPVILPFTTSNTQMTFVFCVCCDVLEQNVVIKITNHYIELSPVMERFTNLQPFVVM